MTMVELTLHRPILKTALAAVTAWLVIAAASWEELGRLDWKTSILFMGLGAAYTHIFEYAYHRVFMHRGVELLGFVKQNHLEHHRFFHGRRFATRRPDVLEHVTGEWFHFPVAFALHYAVLRLVLPEPLVLAFLLGVVVHYVLFETTHWFAHVEDNSFDRFARRLPLLGWAREVQLRHHRLHHETPEVDFNFNPPFAGDWLLGTLVIPGDCDEGGSPQPCFKPASRDLVIGIGPGRAGSPADGSESRA